MKILQSVIVDKRVAGLTPQIVDTPRMTRLSNAMICLEEGCECIFSKNENKIGTSLVACPACGSKSVWYLSKFLNRQESK